LLRLGDIHADRPGPARRAGFKSGGLALLPERPDHPIAALEDNIRQRVADPAGNARDEPDARRRTRCRHDPSSPFSLLLSASLFFWLPLHSGSACAMISGLAQT